jgi:hypothetical protein
MMTDKIQTFKIKCPYCGWNRTISINITDGQIPVVAGKNGNPLHDLTEKIKNLFKDREMDEVNSWIQMNTCPNPPCQHTYEVNLFTGATRK